MVLYVLFYGFIYAEYCRKCISVWFGLDGGLYSMPVSDVLTFVICVAVIMYTYQTLRTECPKPEELVHT